MPRPALNSLLADTIGPDRIALGARLTSYEERQDGVTIRLGNGESLDADLSDDVENAVGPAEFAQRYAAFSHWMLTTAPEN